MGQHQGEISWWFHLLNQPLLRRTMPLRIFLIRGDARLHRSVSYLCLRSSGVANTTEPRCLILRADTRIRIIRKTQYHRHFSSSCIRVTQRSFNPRRIEKAANIPHCRVLIRALNWSNVSYPVKFTIVLFRATLWLKHKGGALLYKQSCHTTTLETSKL